MVKRLLLIITISLLWHMSLSADECNRTFSGNEIRFLCPSNATAGNLLLYDLTVTMLDTYTSIRAGGINGSTGPFTSIPPNICLLRNLQKIDFSFNRIVQVDPTGALTSCLLNVNYLNLQSNNISQFPSTMIYNMPQLTTLNFQNNQLTEVPANAFRNVSLLDTIDFSYNRLTAFEFWALEVQTRADFSHNSISTITNKYFFQNFLNTSNTPTISLTNNTPTINFSDAIYEMYNQCEEAYNQIFNGSFVLNQPLFTLKVANIYFGTSQINCNCDQYYFLRVLYDNFGAGGIPSVLPITTATCSGGSNTSNNSLLINSSCSDSTFDRNSTVNFTQVYPRLCKILDYEDGSLTISMNITAPISNVSTYPHYQTAFMNPGECFFTFTNTTTMSISCTIDISNSSSQMPDELINNPYMAGIKYVIYPSLLSSLPRYLCDLPSDEIDLSYQAFTILTDATFPCLDSFSTITLSHNNLTTVSMSNIDFTKLTTLDLSSNRLTTLPYAILRPTPTSLHYLDLRNNLFSSIDLFIYTLKNITVYLDNNPINTSVIVNPQNVSLDGNTTSSVNITLPSNITSSGTIVQDSTFDGFFTCANFQLIQTTLTFIRSNLNATLRCTCASFKLREFYRANGQNIINTFPCSNVIDGQTFQNLTNTTCSVFTSFQTGSCPVTTTQISTDMPTMNTLNTSDEYTSTSSTIMTGNSSLSSSPSTTLNSINQTQNTNPSGNTSSSENPTSPGGTILAGNSTSSGTTPSGGTPFTGSTTATTSTNSPLNSTTGAPPLQSGNGAETSTNRTGLIVGLVVGLVLGLALLTAIIIALILYFKSKSAAVAGKKKLVSRATVIGQKPGDDLSNRIQPRNLRAVRLAPIAATSTSALPDVPVKAFVAPPNSSLLSNPNTILRTSAKGIPVRLDSIRSPSEVSPQYPPNSNALINSSSFRPISNLSTHHVQLPSQQLPVPKPQKPRANPSLNIGGDLRS